MSIFTRVAESFRKVKNKKTGTTKKVRTKPYIKTKKAAKKSTWP